MTYMYLFLLLKLCKLGLLQLAVDSAMIDCVLQFELISVVKVEGMTGLVQAYAVLSCKTGKICKPI